MKAMVLQMYSLTALLLLQLHGALPLLNMYWKMAVRMMMLQIGIKVLIINAAQSAGAVIGADQAEKGDIVLFDWDGDGVKDHIGIVDVSENGQLVTIEGNTSNQVAQRTYDINDPRLTFCKTTK